MYFLIISFITLEITDGILTYFVVGNNQVGEANPVLQYFAGTRTFMLMKIACAFIGALLLLLVYKRFPRLVQIGTAGIVIFYLAVITWNLSVLI
jgi:hypothetical protein